MVTQIQQNNNITSLPLERSVNRPIERVSVYSNSKAIALNIYDQSNSVGISVQLKTCSEVPHKGQRGEGHVAWSMW